MSGFHDLATRFKKALDLKIEPVGARFFGQDETVPGEVGLLEPEAGLKSYCQGLIAAGRGRSFFGGAEKLGCPLGTAALGLSIDPRNIIQETIKEKHAAGLFAGVDASRATISGAPKLSAGLNRAVLIGPLASFPVTPDLVVVEVVPRDAMWLLYGANYSSGGRQALPQSGGAAGACADIGAWILLNHKVNITFLGLACRLKSGLPAEHLLVGLPAGLFETVTIALEKMSGPIAKLSGARTEL
ncbi:MAG: DUF169 domain-containing protein [Pseudomonadota bacterium]